MGTEEDEEMARRLRGCCGWRGCSLVRETIKANDYQPTAFRARLARILQRVLRTEGPSCAVRRCTRVLACVRTDHVWVPSAAGNIAEIVHQVVSGYSLSHRSELHAELYLILGSIQHRAFHLKRSP